MYVAQAKPLTTDELARLDARWRLGAVLETTSKAWQADVEPVDTNLSRHGRVMEILSEHTCQGWLEGYPLTGRHGLFSSTM
jgi:xylulose-5-phosphate/fructose-6-phosphate phosphoketolase